MKIDKNKTQITTNINSTEEEDFSFWDQSIIMTLIQDKMYKKKLYSPIQEILSNARDAVRELHLKTITAENLDEVSAKNKLKEMYANNPHVEVTLPNEFMPTLTIRDFGVGINPDRMNVIRKVGLSTKNKDNFQTGGFGLGLKSIFAYTSQFFIRSYCDGKCYSYIGQKDINQMGKISLVETEASDLPNGTEIKIPIQVSDFKSVETSVKTIINYWPTAPKMLDDINETWKSHYQSGLKDFIEYSNGILYANHRYDSYKINLLVDGIPYKSLDSVKLEMVGQDKAYYDFFNCVYLKFDIGELTLTINREEVEETKENLQSIVNKIKSLFNEVNAEISQYSTPKFEDLKMYVEKCAYYKKYVELGHYPWYLKNIIDMGDRYCAQVKGPDIIFCYLNGSAEDLRHYWSDGIMTGIQRDEISLVYLEKDNSRNSRNKKTVNLKVREYARTCNFIFKNNYKIYYVDNFYEKAIENHSDLLLIEIQRLNDFENTQWISLHNNEHQKNIIKKLEEKGFIEKKELVTKSSIVTGEFGTTYVFNKNKNKYSSVARRVLINNPLKQYAVESEFKLNDKLMDYSVELGVHISMIAELLKENKIQLINTDSELIKPFSMELIKSILKDKESKFVISDIAKKAYCKSYFPKMMSCYNLFQYLSKSDFLSVLKNEVFLSAMNSDEINYLTHYDKYMYNKDKEKEENDMKPYMTLFKGNEQIKQQVAELFPAMAKVELILEKYPLIKKVGSGLYFYAYRSLDKNDEDCQIVMNLIDYLNKLDAN